MTVQKSERLMNLVIALLVSPGFLTKSRLRVAVEGYRDSADEAFDRMFERDKDELRAIGIAIETGTNDRAFDDEVGYRIRRDEFELPEIALEPDEAAVVGLAARVWQHARLATETSSAIVKLRAAGVAVDPDALTLVEPQLAVSEPSFDPLWDAVVTRTPVSFTYQRPGGEPSAREVEPWSVLSWHGRWYVAGHDRSREDARLFRLSRIVGGVEQIGAAGEYDVPDDADVRALATSLFPAPTTREATVRVRQGFAHSLRRRAVREHGVADGWDEIVVPYATPWELAEEITTFGPHAVVAEPEEVREIVVRRLRAAAAAHVPATADDVTTRDEARR